ncbi:MAG: phenylalanine--tRNA ligase subunit beta [Flavobacteriales bacterium]|nr:phenylalanine--tRNA ligase subunit beta [Flavobacteriales bacterium]
MRISWNWLRQYIPTDITPQEAAELLTSTGLETESVTRFEPVKGMLEGVVIGEVKECAKHPDADRLSVCQVDIGGENLHQIVCGAPNVAAGQKVLVATIGTTIHLPDGTSFVIKKSRIRGQESNGMICAEDELGLGTGHAGIMVLDAAAPVGKGAADFLGLQADEVLEIGLTPNRTDAMGHVGVARDLRAVLVHRHGTDVPLNMPSVADFASDAQADPIGVEVKDSFACPRYAGLLLTEVRVGPSPNWLQERLNAIGLKPINNVVDVTNYVQHDLAQPLHAFDADKLRGRRIVVRMATEGEPFTTLDGRERKLSAQDLVIADAERPACIAGVFGGMESGVTEGTKNVFLESACFEPGTIRRTARRHGLNTDASFRFERGVDPNGTIIALQRAALLLKEVAGARIASPITDVDHRTNHVRSIELSFADCARLTGVGIPADAIVRILELLDFTVTDRNAHRVIVQVPSYRLDVLRPADVIEEILRIHGYDHVPIPEHTQVPAMVHDPLDRTALGGRLTAQLVARGFREVMTPSLVSGAKSNGFPLAEGSAFVRVQNPLSNELDILRPTMLYGLLGAIAYNNNRQQRDLRFLERGRIYSDAHGKVVELDMIAMAITGKRQVESWRTPATPADLFDLKAEVETLLERCGAKGTITWSPMDFPLLTHAHEIVVGGRHIGRIGQVAAATLKSFDVAQPVFFAELSEQALLELVQAQKTAYADVARFPSVRRDLSLLIDGDLRFERLREVAFGAERKLLREVGLFDVYQGDKLAAGKKSYALSFTLQDEEKTLTDDQVDKAMGRIRKAIEGVGAEVRG